MVCGYLGWALISIYFSPLMHFICVLMSLLLFSISRINIPFIFSLLPVFFFSRSFCFKNGVNNNEYDGIETNDEGNENASKITRKHWHFRWCIGSGVVCIFSLNRPWPEENVYQLRYSFRADMRHTYAQPSNFSESVWMSVWTVVCSTQQYNAIPMRMHLFSSKYSEEQNKIIQRTCRFLLLLLSLFHSLLFLYCWCFTRIHTFHFITTRKNTVRGQN